MGRAVLMGILSAGNYENEEEEKAKENCYKIAVAAHVPFLMDWILETIRK